LTIFSLYQGVFKPSKQQPEIFVIRMHKQHKRLPSYGQSSNNPSPKPKKSFIINTFILLLFSFWIFSLHTYISHLLSSLLFTFFFLLTCPHRISFFFFSFTPTLHHQYTQKKVRNTLFLKLLVPTLTLTLKKRLQEKVFRVINVIRKRKEIQPRCKVFVVVVVDVDDDDDHCVD
jgi:hypothetical protein